jgi:hypothetical protein
MKACHDAATMRSTTAADRSVGEPTPCAPPWKTVIDFLDK